MSGHPVYYPWQGRVPQPPSPPTHSFNPWRPRARKLRLPPTPSRRAAPRARQRLSPGLGARQGSGGSTAGLGGNAGPPPPELAPAGTWSAARRASAGPAATSAVPCRGGQPAAAGARLPPHGSARHGAAPLSAGEGRSASGPRPPLPSGGADAPCSSRREPSHLARPQPTCTAGQLSGNRAEVLAANI